MGVNINISGYELSRKWFDFCFENPERINTNHSAVYFFAIEHCNRLGWKEKFGFPTQMAMDALGIKNYKTFIKSFNDLIDFGFIKLIEKSKNQYSSNIVALVKNTKATTKALDKASLKHGTKHSPKHSPKQVQSIVSIDKQVTINHEPLTINKEQEDISSEKNSEIFSEEIKMPFTSENFQVLWQNWKTYRHQEFKRKYKSIQSEQATLSHLAKISDGDEKTATEIIAKSIANQWQGLFELKNYKNGTYQNKRNGAEVSAKSAFSKIDSMPDKTGSS